MKALTVGEVKTNFSELISLVRKGEKVKILYGKSKKPVAMLVPLEDKSAPRKIGIFDGKAVFRMKGNGKITEEEFISR